MFPVICWKQDLRIQLKSELEILQLLVLIGNSEEEITSFTDLKTKVHFLHGSGSPR